MNAQKILIIGCPGSGKSTLARALGDALRLPVIHLDMLYWNADKTTVDKETFLARLTDAMQGDAWIMDGNFSGTLDLRLQACDTVIFLDYPTELCLKSVAMRRGKPRPDMPWVETEPDPEFIDFITHFATLRKPQILQRLARYPEKKIVVLTTREEGDAFLARVRECGEI